MNQVGNKLENKKNRDDFVTVKVKRRTVEKLRDYKKKYGTPIGVFIDQAVNEKLKKKL